jgi:hypothetical protein
LPRPDEINNLAFDVPSYVRPGTTLVDAGQTAIAV